MILPVHLDPFPLLIDPLVKQQDYAQRRLVPSYQYRVFLILELDTKSYTKTRE